MESGDQVTPNTRGDGLWSAKIMINLKSILLWKSFMLVRDK